MHKGRVAPGLEKTPSRTHLFTVDMFSGGRRPDSAVSTDGVNPSINSNNMADNHSSHSGSSAGNFSTTIPIFRGAHSGHPPSRASTAQSQLRDPKEPAEEQAIPKISVKSRGNDSSAETGDIVAGNHTEPEMEPDQNQQLSPLINEPVPER
ncbi:hypothetical protein PoB_000466000 [Plakobranchus ocellatus]|uniref:Uncharacterized protein n=1 Tax=Plakobranchus ocellatus TaxID=259542 RepID=A0AAV3Y4Z2_9GAST|nr:hypothetical protein PoB_000466000 [Plakobranchus ocellatus]